jgi:hypothetical protein
MLSGGVSASFLDTLMLVLLIKFILIMWIVSMASIAVAMFVSVFISTPAAASAILPFVLIVQILMGGSAIQPVLEMNKVIRPVSNLMVSRWGFEATILLFEKNLNFDMERFKQRDGTFSNFSFTGARLRKTDEKKYIEHIDIKMKSNKKIIPEIVTHNNTILDLWYDALTEALDVNAFSNYDATEKQKKKLESLKPLLNDIKIYKERLNSIRKNGEQITLKEIESVREELKKKNIPDWIVTKATTFFITPEVGPYMKKVEKVFSNLDQENTPSGKNILKHAMSNDIDPELKLFRVENSLKTWGVLYFMIGSFLIFTIIFFNRTRKKEKMFF